VDWDTVGFPAVPRALCVNTSGAVVEGGINSINELEKGLKDQISSAIVDAYEKYPTNDWIAAMFNALNLKEKKAKVFPMDNAVAASFKKSYPSSNKVVSSFNKRK
jgi:hypothetical protein